jgi:hypothetical protein
MFGPIASILAALIAFKKQSFIQMWVPELAGMLMFCGALAMVGFVATDRMTLLPAAASALGALILLVASDELKNRAGRVRFRARRFPANSVAIRRRRRACGSPGPTV